MKRILILCWTTTILLSSMARADWCVLATAIPASNDSFKVDAKYDQSSKAWKYTLTDLKTGESKNGPLKHIGFHAHLAFFISKDGKTFGVIRTRAGHGHDSRFLLYGSDGVLISKLDLKDMLNDQEIVAARKAQSMEHFKWLDSDAKNENYGQYQPRSNTIRLKSLLGRQFYISLRTGKVVKPKESANQ